MSSVDDHPLPVTLRLTASRGTLSRDDGSSVDLQASTLSDLVSLLPSIPQRADGVVSSVMSATAQASLAEAHIARPNGIREGAPRGKSSVFQ